VAASQSAHTSCTAFGSAFHTDEHGKNEPCRAVKPGAKRQAERRRSIRDVCEGSAVRGWYEKAARRERMTDTIARGAAGSRALLLEASAEEPNWSRSQRMPPAQRRSSAGRPTRATLWRRKAVGTGGGGKSQREGGRLQRGLGGAAGVAASQSAHTSCNDFGSANARTGTARISRAEPCTQRRSAKRGDGEAYATRVKNTRWLAGTRGRVDERR
jgi:hypothetical protein